MADLIIKPNSATGDKLILQDRAGGAVLTTASSGATLSNNTQDNITRLGTVTSGTLEDAVTYRGINQDLGTTDNPTFANQPICVWAGWNSASNSTTGSWVALPLNSDRLAVNTTYMTKSGGTFTVVKAGQYLINLNTMSQIDYNEYAHFRIQRNGTQYFQTHSYGSSSSNKWTDHSFSLMVDCSATNTLDFHGYMNSGGGYLWHDGYSYSQLNIWWMHAS